MSGEIATIKFDLDASQETASDYRGRVLSNFPPLDERWGPGNSSGEFNAMWGGSRTLAATNGETLSLQALTGGPSGATVSFAEVRFFGVSVASSAPDALEIQLDDPGGWRALLSGQAYQGNSSDATIKVQPGASMILTCGVDGKYPVSASSHYLIFRNSSSSSALTYTILILGTTA